MSIVKHENYTNIILGNGDVNILACVIDDRTKEGLEEIPTLIMQEFTEEMKKDNGFPFSYKGKPTTELSHVRVSFKDIKAIERYAEIITSFIDSLKREEEYFLQQSQSQQKEEKVCSTMKDKIFEDLKTAMKMKDTLKKGLLQIIKSNLDMAEKEKGSALTDVESFTVLQKEAKQIKQSIEGAKKAGRDDIISQENTKLSIVESYLPEMLNIEAVTSILYDKGVKKGMNMGDAMKIAKQHLTGLAENSVIAQAVKGIINE